ncbi:acyl-CoA dehydrogenase family protein [Gordonia sp. ABSL1-1]|uniref:acyl-CoA dehydrogenase family protein n=1 Tax=Gordonia sp. ABSL1-1 TaxID=3053923 RepID=UPI002573826B|nr:acyl-CoA dehydrogenase family protein [Gordonia sp. ABSL1-1]MDL9935330.1 acyl-CoA dehydrogenase family protein [Gordonia sp. ABSL1-1]
MDQRLTTESQIDPDEVRRALRDYFADHPGIAEVRDNRDEAGDAARRRAGFDESNWQLLAAQVGVVGLAAASDWGGLAVPTGHLVAMAEECGRALYPGPIRAALLLARALGDRTEIADGLPMQEVLDGRRIVGSPAADPDRIRATWADGHLTGRLHSVNHGGRADLVVTEVSTPGGVALAVADLIGGAGIDRRELRTVDFGSTPADLDLTGVPAILLTEPGDDDAVRRHRRLDTLLLAAEQVGGAQGCLDAMVDYAGVRTQFGRLIGTYQAVAHRCARTAVAVAAARALTQQAASAHDAGSADAAEQGALLARAEAADAYCAGASALIQVSGGIGFTWEHDAHLHFRHARVTAAVGGTPDRLRDRAVAAGCLDLLVTPASGKGTHS